MTRETKIGLLVGLAFIIVIGILLSDHLTSSTEPLPAPLARAGQFVGSSVATPAGSQAPYSPIVTPPQVQPIQPVPTPRDLKPQTPANAVVQIIGVGGPSIQVQGTQAQTSQAPDIMFVQPQKANNTLPDQPAVVTVNEQANPLNQQNGEAVVPVATENAQQFSQPAAKAQPQNPIPQMGFRDYVAQSGDTVSKMAMKFFGNRNKASIDAIVRANSVLQQDPNKVIEGKTYRIPISTDASPVASVSAPSQQAASPTASSVAKPARQTSTATEYWYTVSEGDTLWGIAKDQLGNPGAVNAIKELNKDLLNGNDKIIADMKLRLPGKPIARAN